MIDMLEETNVFYTSKMIMYLQEIYLMDKISISDAYFSFT